MVCVIRSSGIVIIITYNTHFSLTLVIYETETRIIYDGILNQITRPRRIRFVLYTKIYAMKKKSNKQRRKSQCDNSNAYFFALVR